MADALGCYVVLCCCEGGGDVALGLRCAHGSDGDTPSTWEVEGELWQDDGPTVGSCC